MRFESPKFVKMRLRPRRHPRPLWGSVTAGKGGGQKAREGEDIGPIWGVGRSLPVAERGWTPINPRCQFLTTSVCAIAYLIYSVTLLNS